MLVLDFLLLVMIGICITYCWILNRRIQDLQNSRIEFARMIKELNVSIVKAETSVSELSQLSKVTSNELQNYIVEAKAASDELNSLNDISNNLANTLSNQVDWAKKEFRNNNYDIGENRHSMKTDENNKQRFGDDDLVDLPGENEKKFSYTNHLKSFINHIVTKKPQENVSLNQMNYYDTLRKISAKK